MGEIRRAGRAVDERRARSVISERLGNSFNGEIAGMFAGPVPIPVPDGMKDPGQLIKLLGNTSFAMQLGHAAGDLSHEVNGSFDQGIALLKNPAGGLIMQNIEEYATSLDIPVAEVTRSWRCAKSRTPVCSQECRG